MKCFFQLLDSKSGQRSPAVGQDRSKFANSLADVIPVEDRSEVYVLVLVEDPGETEWKFSTAPAMTVATFIANFATVEVSANV